MIDSNCPIGWFLLATISKEPGGGGSPKTWTAPLSGNRYIQATRIS